MTPWRRMQIIKNKLLKNEDVVCPVCSVEVLGSDDIVLYVKNTQASPDAVRNLGLKHRGCEVRRLARGAAEGIVINDKACPVCGVEWKDNDEISWGDDGIIRHKRCVVAGSQ